MTRLWYGVEPAELCDQHLLGEHSEMHQEVGTLRNHPHGEAIVEGHVAKGQVSMPAVEARHDALAAELRRRGMNHDSPLSCDVDDYAAEMDAAANRSDLAARCPDCRARMTSATDPE